VLLEQQNYLRITDCEGQAYRLTAIAELWAKEDRVLRRARRIGVLGTMVGLRRNCVKETGVDRVKSLKNRMLSILVVSF
jgi:hypothetical protein